MNSNRVVASGFVHLVGAGPGDPGLLTVRAAEILRTAEIVVYDRLVGDDVLAMAGTHERIYVGKGKDCHSVSQSEINDLLVRLGRDGRRVCRLKGGDPFVFGRGGEEAANLAKAGVSFEVVPGVTSAVAAPAYAGIPLTDRSVSSSFACVTAHQQSEESLQTIDWVCLSRACDTIVILMGASRISWLVDELAGAGLESSHPVAIVESGTLPTQRVIRGNLGDIVRKSEQVEIGSPSVVVVGHVVKLADSIDWVGSRPLQGTSVVVTRDEGAMGSLSSLLRSFGAQVVRFPTGRVLPLQDESPLCETVSNLQSYDWVVFMSASAVLHVYRAIEAVGGDARLFGSCRVGAIGPGTSRALKERGIVPDLIPETYVSESLSEAMLGKLASKSRIGVFGAISGRETLATELTTKGHQVDRLSAYRNVPTELDPLNIAALKAGKFNWITFTSSSSVQRLVEGVGGSAMFPADTKVACIGLPTAAVAEALGLAVTTVGDEHTMEALAFAIVEHDREARS